MGFLSSELVVICHSAHSQVVNKWSKIFTVAVYEIVAVDEMYSSPDAQDSRFAI